MFILLPFYLLVLQSLHSNPSEPKANPCIESTDFLFKSGDNGQTWQGMGKGFPGQKQPTSIWSDVAELYLGTPDGLYKSTTAFPVLQWKKEMLYQDKITGIYPGEIGPYAISQWVGFFQYETITGMWKAMHENLEDKTVYTVLESKDRVLFAGGGSGIYRSADRGKSWQRVFDKGVVTSLVEMDGSLVCCSNSGIWRSKDGGTGWERTLTSVSEAFLLQSLGNDLITITPGQEFGGIRTPNVIYVSADQGSTWKPMDINLPPALSHVYDLRQVGGYYFACSDNEIFRSADRGVTWTSVFRHGDKGNFYKMTVSGNNLFAILIQGC